jgi:hypothetical protein
MKFTPSAKFLRIASSTFKVLERKAYFRKTSTLAGALSTGTWTEATSRLQPVPECISQIEYGLGQFSADSIQLVGKDIAWWTANVFNATATEYIECKIELRVGDDPLNIATDIVYYFSGMVDKKSIYPSESDDSYSFTVDTADVIAGNMLGEFITTQYYDSTRGGVVLFRIPGVYVISANTGENPVSAGVHTVSYDYNGNQPQVRFNTGLWVPVSASGTYVLGNGTAEVATTEQISVKVYYDELARDTKERSENIIILTSPTTLPATWYSGVSLRSLLKNIYTKIGITSQTFTLAQVDSHDGTDRVSMLECIHDAETVKGMSWGIAYVSTTLIFVANANNVYSFNPVTGAIVLVTSVTSGKSISKLMYNARNQHLWILFGDNATYKYGGSLARYDVVTDTLQATVTVAGAQFNNIELIDVQHLGTWEYSLLYVNVVTRSVMRVDGAARTLAVLFANTDLGYASSAGPLSNFAYQATDDAFRVYRFQAQNDVGTIVVHEIGIDTTNAASWVDDGQINAAAPLSHIVGAFDGTTVYGYNSNSRKVQSYDPVGATAADVYTLPDNDFIEGMYHDGTNLYFTTAIERFVHVFDGSAVAILEQSVYAGYTSLTSGDGKLFGVDVAGRVFQVASTIELFLDQCVFAGRTIKNALTDTLRACNCVGTISAAKTAIVYPRGDSDGDPVTSTNKIAITASNAEDIERDPEYGQAFSIIEIDNGEVKINYNGTAFNVMPASLDERILRIQNALIPTSVVKDYLKMFYEFFKTPRVLYTFPVLQTLFHIEPMDAADVTFATTKIQVAATDCPIYNVTYNAENGQMKVGVLV